MNNDVLRYVCDNDLCERAGVVTVVERGYDAVCRVCGWFMNAR